MPRQVADAEFSGSRHKIVIKGCAMEILKEHEQDGGSDESGGILLGYVYKDHAEVVEVTVPNQLDSSGPRFFVRSRAGAQPKVDEAWKKSHGTLIYLGEWHTHSQVNPLPAGTDRRMIKNVLEQAEMEIDFLFLIIVGQEDTFWVGRQTRRGLTELMPSGSRGASGTVTWFKKHSQESRGRIP